MKKEKTLPQSCFKHLEVVLKDHQVNVFRYFSFLIFGKFSIDPVLVVANW